MTIFAHFPRPGENDPYMDLAQFQVLEPDLGWAGFREGNRASTWTWVSAATRAWYFNILFKLPKSIVLHLTLVSSRFLLYNGCPHEDAKAT